MIPKIPLVVDAPIAHSPTNSNENWPGMFKGPKGDSGDASYLTNQTEISTFINGQIGYQTASGWVLANSSNSTELLGLRTAAGTFLINGIYATTGLTVGIYYLNTVDSMPSSIETSKSIGYAVSSTQLLFQPGSNSGVSNGDFDGGSADSIYLFLQRIDGGTA